MYNDKNKKWIYFAISGLVISIISLLFPIITYTDQRGTAHAFNIFQLLSGGFAQIVQGEYTGESLIRLSQSSFDAIIAVIGVLGTIAIVLSMIGLRSMSKQYESQWPFRLTLCGLIGTAIPAFLLLTAFALSTNYYLGEISLGLYVIITPVAMIASCVAVIKRHQLTKAELEIQKEAAKYIYVAGDLPPLQ